MVPEQAWQTPGLKLLRDSYPQPERVIELWTRFVTNASPRVRGIFDEVDRLSTADLVRGLAEEQRKPHSRKGLHLYSRFPLEQIFFHPTGGKEDVKQAATWIQSFELVPESMWDTKDIRAQYMLYRFLALIGGDPEVPLFPKSMADPQQGYFRYLTSKAVVDNIGR